MKRTIRVKAPGKLYVAGEYAVVEAGHKAILVAIDRFINALISPAKLGQMGSIFSTVNGNVPLHWKLIDQEFQLREKEDTFPYITQAIRLVIEYMNEVGFTVEPFDLHFRSTLDSEEGEKYGLGSSGAVTVATIKAMDIYFGLGLDNRQIYKLAALTHLDLGSKGSFGDIAASVFAGWMTYSTFDRDWVLARRANAPVHIIINELWPKLRVRPIDIVDDAKLVVGWTESPASTEKMVTHVHNKVPVEAAEYQMFLEESDRCVADLIDGLQTGNREKIYDAMAYNRVLLNRLGDLSNLVIETPKLEELIETALALGLPSKSSGAGGGDCGIAIAFSDEEVNNLRGAWAEAGIMPLPLVVTEEYVGEEINHD